MWRALLLISLGGCQCLQPVDEDAGVDAGREQDAGSECERPSDCTGVPQVTSWCRDGGLFSCVDRHCVAQCSENAGQTCVQDPGVECLRCPPTTSCIPPSCGAGLDFDFHVEAFACAGVSPLSLGLLVREELSTDGGCGSGLFIAQPDGGRERLGTIYAQSARGLSARIEALGGTCLVNELPTGALRLQFDCPRCQFTLGP